MNKSARRGSILLIVLAAIAVLIAAGTYYKLYTKTPQDKPSLTQEPRKSSTENDQIKSYVSQDLKFSFKYPKEWYVIEEYPFTLISNFESSLRKNIILESNQIEITIKEFSPCLPTLDEDLINPACGQGKVKNKIVSKDVKQTANGEYLKYTLESYDPNQRVQYFFQKDERILDIEKHPDPSQFEKEFEEIINSIQFL